MTRTSRSTLALVFLVALGLLTASYAIWVQGTQIAANQQTIKQQQRALNDLIGQAAQDRAEQERLRRLVQALQDQVRQLGGTPLLTAPSDQTPAPATPAAPAPAPASPTPAAPSPSPRTSATPRPGRSPVPAPTSSPTRLCLPGNICLPPGAAR